MSRVEVRAEVQCSPYTGEFAVEYELWTNDPTGRRVIRCLPFRESHWHPNGRPRLVLPLYKFLDPEGDGGEGEILAGVYDEAMALMGGAGEVVLRDVTARYPSNLRNRSCDVD